MQSLFTTVRCQKYFMFWWLFDKMRDIYYTVISNESLFILFSKKIVSKWRRELHIERIEPKREESIPKAVVEWNGFNCTIWLKYVTVEYRFEILAAIRKYFKLQIMCNQIQRFEC